MKKIGFVIPWYGEKIGGGAEAELRGVVHHLKDAGVELEVLTTCVECFASDWNRNFHKPYKDFRRSNTDFFGTDRCCSRTDRNNGPDHSSPYYHRNFRQFHGPAQNAGP